MDDSAIVEAADSEDPSMLGYLACKMYCACKDTDRDRVKKGIRRLECKDRKYRLKTYKDCFIGQQAVDWLMDPKGGGLENLAAAVAKGNAMIAMGYLDHVCGSHGFESKYYFYRWCCNPVLAAPAAAADGTFGSNPSWQVPVTPPNGMLEEIDPALWVDASDSPARPVHVDGGAVASGLASELVGVDRGLDLRNLDAALSRITDLERRLSAEEDNARRREKAMPLFVMMAVVVGSTELGVAAMVAMLCLVMAVLKRDPFGRFAVGAAPVAAWSSAARPMMIHTAHRQPSPPPPAATNTASSSSVDGGASTAAAEGAGVDATAAQAPPPLNDPGYGAMPVIENVLGLPSSMPINKITAFENKHFVGSFVLLLKTDPVHPATMPYFEGKQRVVELQVSGRFKTKPRGTLFLGGEILGIDKMKLSAIWRGFAWAVLGVINRLTAGTIHECFGTPDERPHIVTTFFNVAERLVVTPAGEIPPPIGCQLPESDAARKARKRSSKHPDVDTESTYAFSYHTAYVDLLGWNAMLPGLGSMDLHKFWRDGSFCFLLYDSADGDAKTMHKFAGRRDFLNFKVSEKVDDVSDVGI